MSLFTRDLTRYPGRVSNYLLFWMVAFAFLSTLGGVSYAWSKYDQVIVRTEIEKINREVALCRLNANQYRAKTDALANGWTMRDRLSQEGSELRDIRHGQIEIAQSTHNPGSIRTTASR